MNKYKTLIEACGMSPKGASSRLNIEHVKSRQWACGARKTPTKEYNLALKRLTRISKAIDKIMEETT